jgi:hypothetical protein
LSARIVVVIPHDVVASTLVESGALSDLASRHAVRYLVSPSVKAVFPGPQESLEPRALASRLARSLDFHFWNLSLFSYYRHHGLQASTSLKGARLPAGHRRIYSILSHPLPSRLLSVLDRRVFFAQDRGISEFLRRERAQLVLAPASAMDTYSHLVLRSAAYLGIPSAMLVSHWDYFSKKGLLRVSPDKIYVWGDDMRRSAIEHNGLDPRRISVVGAPQFEKYLQPMDGRRGPARGRLGVDASTRVVLFPGTSAPFDELSVIALLDKAITSNIALRHVRILYRPHPRAWARRSAGDIDPRALANVTLDDPARPGGTTENHYLDLMAAVDGVVSPFSTMTLEAAVCGKPSLCIGFSDGVNAWDFREATNTEHIRSVEGKRWLKVCTDRSLMASAFADFVAALEEPDLAQRIRQEVQSTVFYNANSYAKRLADQIQADFASALKTRA